MMPRQMVGDKETLSASPFWKRHSSLRSQIYTVLFTVLAFPIRN